MCSLSSSLGHAGAGVWAWAGEETRNDEARRQQSATVQHQRTSALAGTTFQPRSSTLAPALAGPG